MRWQSSGTGLTAWTACITGRPNVRFGTKWASITSKCSQSASATRWASSPRRAKSADRRLGAINGSRDTSAESRCAATGDPAPAVDSAEPARALTCGHAAGEDIDVDLSTGVAVRLAAICLDRRRPAAGVRHLGHGRPRRPARRPRPGRPARRRGRQHRDRRHAHRLRTRRPAARGHRRWSPSVRWSGGSTTAASGWRTSPTPRSGPAAGRSAARSWAAATTTSTPERCTTPPSESVPTTGCRPTTPPSPPWPPPAGAWGRRPEEPAEEDLTDCGPLRWICETVTGHLQEAQRRNLRAAGAADGTGSPYY